MTSRHWSHPNATAVTVVVGAWVAMVATHLLGTAPTAPGSRLLMWALMACAMMIPIAMPAVEHVASNSLRRRRTRSVLTFLMSYLSVWVLFGAAALSLVWVWDKLATGSVLGIVLPVTSLTVAAVWQMSSPRRRLIARCHKPVPLPAVGWRATAGAVRFGFTYGGRCVSVCWAAMLVMGTITTGHLVWTVLLTMMIVGERSVRWLRRNQWALASVFAVPLVFALMASATSNQANLFWFCSTPVS